MPSFPLIKTAVPSWDNDARRQGTGLVLQGSTPAKYQAWLGQLIEKAREKPFFGEHFVCVNAWNEWCEAAYLEPDLHYGSAYLNATGRAVAAVPTAKANPQPKPEERAAAPAPAVPAGYEGLSTRSPAKVPAAGSGAPKHLTGHSRWKRYSTAG